MLEPLFVFFQLVVVDHKMVSQSGCIILGRIVIPFLFVEQMEGGLEKAEQRPITDGRYSGHLNEADLRRPSLRGR